jgi:T5SS/PEP-CTERM-associated repeat protein
MWIKRFFIFFPGARRTIRRDRFSVSAVCRGPDGSRCPKRPVAADARNSEKPFPWQTPHRPSVLNPVAGVKEHAIDKPPIRTAQIMENLAHSCALSAFVLALAGNASAQTNWTGASGSDLDWNNPANWSWGGDPLFPVVPPDATVKANVWNSPGPVISSATTPVKQLDLGATGGSVLEITSGNLTVNEWLIVGYGASATGTLKINGGAVSQPGSGQDLTIGREGTGHVVMTAGSLSVVDELRMGWETATGIGHFTMSGAGTTATFNDAYVGRFGKGYLTVNDGTLTFRSGSSFHLRLADEPGSEGHLTINGGVVQLEDRVLVGTGGLGSLTVAGGTLRNFDDLHVGDTSAGSMTMSSGSVSGFDALVIGNANSSVGDMTMNGATAAIVSNGLLMIGNLAGSSGTLMMEAGSITVGNIAYVGFNGAGLLEMTGGTITLPADKPLVIGRNNGSSGEVLLKGGTITAGTLEFTAAGQVSLLSHMDITGGTLVLSGDKVGLVNGYIGAGYLTTAYGGTELLNVVYDANTGFTSVTAIPESSTLAVYSLLGLISISRRRRSYRPPSTDCI